MARVLALGGAALLLVCVVVLTLLLTGTSLGPFKPVLEARLSDFLGRQIQFTGPVEVQAGRTVSVLVEGVELANAGWAGDVPLATLEHAAIEIETRTLFGEGPIVINSLEVDGLDVALATNADGTSNLPIIGSADTDEGTQTEDDSTLGFVSKSIRLSGVRIGRTGIDNTPALDFRINALSQELIDDGLSIVGSGSLQSRPWSLEGSGSDFDSLLLGKNLHAQFTAELDELRLEANYQLPDARQLRDLSLHAILHGPLPPRIAELSPLLEVGKPMHIQVDVLDIDPGIRVDVDADLGQLRVSADGEIARPDDGDGIDLVLGLDAGSLPRLAAALDLGEADEVPLSIGAKLGRDRRRIELNDIKVTAGDHRVTGRVVIPSFPGTDDARADLLLAGPDFGFWQKLLSSPATLNEAYTLDISLTGDASDAELIDANLSIGAVQGELTGTLGPFPTYANSQLELHLNGPDLQAVGALAQLSLPETGFSIDAAVAVADSGLITVQQLSASSAGVKLDASGQLNGHPNFDALQLRVTGSARSLAETSTYFDAQTLGDVPASVSLDMGGELATPHLSNLKLQAGGVTVQSTGGTIGLAESGFVSDLKVRAEIVELPTLLGDYAPPAMRGEAWNFSLASAVNASTIGFNLEDLRGPGITGSADLSLPSDLAIDERAHMEVDLRVDEPQGAFPTLEIYTPPASAISIHAQTRGGTGDRRIEFSATTGNTPLLAGLLDLGRKGSGNVALSLRGSGPDLHALGSTKGMPDMPLPYSADLSLRRADGALSLSLTELEVSDTQVSGSASYNTGNRRLEADIEIPRGNLQPWLDTLLGDKTPEPDAANTAESDGHVIPDTPLPLEFMNAYEVEVLLKTGDLGVQDPVFPDESLLTALDLTLSSNREVLSLQVDELRGSRGKLTAFGELRASEAGARLRSELSLQGLPIGFLSAGNSLDALPGNDISAQFTSQGRTVRELVAGLDGEFFLIGGPGKLDDINFSFATESFFAQLIGTLLPGLQTSSPDMNVECAVLAVRAEDGKLALDPGFVFRTERVDLSARGTVDLNSEALAVRFDNQARKGFGISAASLINPYVQITGTMAKPALGLDVKSSALAGGAAVATGGLTVLAKPLYGRFLKRDNPCDTAQRRWQEAKAQRTPSPGA